MDRSARRGKERTQVAEVLLTADMADEEAVEATALAASEDDVLRACILRKWQRRNTHALAREKNRTIHALIGLFSKEEKKGSDQ